MGAAVAAAPKKRRKRRAKRGPSPKRRPARQQRRSTRQRRRVVRVPRRSVLDAIIRAFGPENPYDEREAALDALSGKEPCKHGRWPHEGGICPLCAGEAAVKVCQHLFGPK